MLSLSTAWKSAEITTGFELLKAILDTAFTAVELDYRITESMHREILPSLKRNDVEVTSIHNYFPFPDDLDRKQASGDRFLLSSLDKDERELGIKATVKTIQTANDLEARAVVLHLGKVDMAEEKERLHEFADLERLDTEAYQEFIDTKLAERDSKSAKHLDALFFSLEKINREAERQNILVGLENRLNYHEMPNLKEFKSIFENFEGSNLRYWHDTGHAQRNEHLRLQNHEEYLETLANKLIGVHLHDAVNREDHLAPGAGTIDFDMVKKYFNEHTIKVVEVHSKVSREELFNGQAFLLAKGY